MVLLTIMSKIVEELEGNLKKYGREIIRNNLRLPKQYKKSFLLNIDHVNEHDPRWHQWGIISHSIMVRKAFDTEVWKYLRKWGIINEIEEYLEEDIDGMGKNRLFRMSLPLHDIGKFNKGLKQEEGRVRPDFSNHWVFSEKIINSESFRKELKTYELTDKQIDYIAKCTGYHYELNYPRKEAERRGIGYSMKFLKSDLGKETIQECYKNSDDMKIEAGLIFLADSLGKTDLRISAINDEEIEEKLPILKKKIENRDLNPSLIHIVKQGPLNRRVSKDYLEVVLNREKWRH